MDSSGYRRNVGIVLASTRGYLFWARRIGQDTWQFPQGGVDDGESAEDALYRELYEEVGLAGSDVRVLASTHDWLPYTLPEQYQRRHSKPMLKGQLQKWFLLRLVTSEQKIRLDLNDSPEFDSWRWVEYSRPVQEVIYFKREVYRTALNQFKPILLGDGKSLSKDENWVK